MGVISMNPGVWVADFWALTPFTEFVIKVANIIWKVKNDSRTIASFRFLKPFLIVLDLPYCELVCIWKSHSAPLHFYYRVETTKT